MSFGRVGVQLENNWMKRYTSVAGRLLTGEWSNGRLVMEIESNMIDPVNLGFHQLFRGSSTCDFAPKQKEAYEIESSFSDAPTGQPKIEPPALGLGA